MLSIARMAMRRAGRCCCLLACVAFAVGQLQTAARSETGSNTWSGFVLYPSQAGWPGISAVEASWIVPTVNYDTYGGTNTADEVISVWLGIGGTAGDQTLIQFGTASRVHSDNSATYYAWYELVPANDILIQTLCYSYTSQQFNSPCPVQPGDHMQADMFCQGGNGSSCPNFFIWLRNNTQNWVFEQGVDYSSSESSAEWIVEQPSGYLLPQYTPVVFTGVQAAGGNTDHFSTSLSLGANGWLIGTVSTPCPPSWVGNAGINFYVLPVWNGPACGVPSAARSKDHTGNGMSDILWAARGGGGHGNSPSAGDADIALWMMDGAAVQQSAAVSDVPLNWSVVGQRDFNGDGTADLLWLDNAGDLAVWLMNGGSVSSYQGLGNVGTQWQVAGTGDFDGDGTGDILWRNSATGDVAVWLMNSGQLAQGIDLGVVPQTWQIVGTGDFDGDGTTDILWRDTTTGDLAVWFMAGGTVGGGADLGTVPLSWTVVGTGDFNGDDTSDILWRDTAGNLAIWLMSVGQFSSGAAIAQVPTTWSVAETGDFNGDNMSDILWIDQSGDLGVWLMNGLSVSEYDGLGNVGASWQVQNASAD